MAKVVGVRFKNAGKLFYFSPNDLWPMAGNDVIVETSRGIEFGKVVMGIREVDDELLSLPLMPILRIADEKDIAHMNEIEEFQKRAFEICKQKIEEHQLEMKLVDVEETFDGGKILFYFTAGNRVDFRALVKDLAAAFHTRIELRQIGVRDEAKLLGGLGPCGRPICCGNFLGDFQPVSIKMAKEQSLSLNPTKISGICGRLMCCLKFEEDQYETSRRNMPRTGREVETPDGRGIVAETNPLTEKVTVRILKADSTEIKTYSVSDIKWQRNNTDDLTEAEEMPSQSKSEMNQQAKNADQAEQPSAKNDWMLAVEAALSAAEKNSGC